MKLLRDLTIILLALVAIACAQDKPGSRNVDLGPTPTPIDPNAISGQNAVPRANTFGMAIKHYTCPNNCANSGGPAAGTCPTCGSAYQHNQAWHNQPNNQVPQTPNPATQAPAAASTAPGLYHYTCPKGCTGGAGTAQPCLTCGTQLAHNQAWHNQPGLATPSTPSQTPAKSPLFVN